jgi:anaerobic ribonucleoside-triphosphate reductase activating protein
MELIHNGIKVIYPDTMDGDEARKHADHEIKMWTQEYTHKQLGTVIIRPDNEDAEYVKIEAIEKSPIRRIRRITGYLAPITAFNDAKLAELGDRYAHLSEDQRAIRETF